MIRRMARETRPVPGAGRRYALDVLAKSQPVDTRVDEVTDDLTLQAITA
jgi:hypothetical protein